MQDESPSKLIPETLHCLITERHIGTPNAALPSADAAHGYSCKLFKMVPVPLGCPSSHSRWPLRMPSAQDVSHQVGISGAGGEAESEPAVSSWQWGCLGTGRDRPVSCPKRCVSAQREFPNLPAPVPPERQGRVSAACVGRGSTERGSCAARAAQGRAASVAVGAALPSLSSSCELPNMRGGTGP